MPGRDYQHLRITSMIDNPCLKIGNTMPFKKIGLCEELVQGILATGYTAPTEIQAEAIPAAIEGRDIIGCAQTGTGKTAAFVLPILNRLATVKGKTKKKCPRALIVTPTRELAVQIERAVIGYGRFIKMFSLAIYGGASIDKQCKILRKGVDVVVATPGRLLDLVNRGAVNLSAVEVLVLDEADLMLDMGFINDIKKIIKEVPKEHQTLLFSATMSDQLSVLTNDILKQPKQIQIGKQHNPIETITQHIYPVMQEQKMDMLLHMIKSEMMFSVLIFSKTKRGADKICKTLIRNGVKADSIHSDKTQRQRQRTMDGFRKGKYQVMVATDVAARGINVEGISHVFNYDVPAYAEDYVHRIGRTGRAAATGDAITFVSSEEIRHIRKIEKFIDRKFTAEYLDDFDYIKRLFLEEGKGGKKSGGRKRVGSSQRRRQKSQSSAGGNRERAGKNRSGSGVGKKRSPKKSEGIKTASSKKAFKPKSKGGNTESSARPKTKKTAKKKSFNKSERFNDAPGKSKKTFKKKSGPTAKRKSVGAKFKKAKRK